MQFSKQIVGCLVLWAALCSNAEAGVYSGRVKSVGTSKLTIAYITRSGTRTFRVGATTRVTVNGRSAALKDLDESMRVSVFTSGTNVLRITARVEKPASSSPKKETTASTKPMPTASTNTSPMPRSRPRSTPAVASSDWPQFNGAARDNRSTETGLLSEWPSGGPRLLYTARGLGEGYSSVSVVGDRVYTMGNVGNREMVICLDASDGRQVWAEPTGGAAYREGQGNGPRGTPAVSDGHVYGLGANGDLACLKAADGSRVWGLNVLREFNGRNITWGISESVLVDGDRVICAPGGRGGTVVAFDKSNGRPVWRAVVPGNPAASYASVTPATIGGVKQYVAFTSRGVVGVRASDGNVLWGDDASSNGTANCSSPLIDGNTVFTASGYGKGGALLRLQSSRNSTRASRAYHTPDMKNHHGDMVVVDGHLYGSSDPGLLTCIELNSGRVKWRDRGVGKGSITFADGHLYCRSERGPIALVEATPSGFREKGRFDQPSRSNRSSWSHPVVAHGKLWLRDMDALLVYDVKK